VVDAVDVTVPGPHAALVRVVLDLVRGAGHARAAGREQRLEVGPRRPLAEVVPGHQCRAVPERRDAVADLDGGAHAPMRTPSGCG
jgi:hypothetical protein